MSGSAFLDLGLADCWAIAHSALVVEEFVVTKKELEEQNAGLRDMLRTSFEILRTTLAFVAAI
jgi:hypothetical protein